MMNQYDARLAPYARQMRDWAARVATPRLVQELEVLEDVARAQSLTIGVQPQIEIAVIAVGDEIQRRIYGVYPRDCFSFVLGGR